MWIFKNAYKIIVIFQIMIMPILSLGPSTRKKAKYMLNPEFRKNAHSPKNFIETRKVNFVTILAQIFTFSCLFQTEPRLAYAFENALPNNYQMPKSHGPAPTNLGLNKKSGVLRSCPKPSPNCFSTTSDKLGMETGSDDDEDELDESMIDIHLIPKWKYNGVDPKEAYKLIGDVLESYEPGQSNIDGGGFKIINKDNNNRYYYVQYESLKRGYIDDLEIVVNDDNTIQVGSSSRLGYLDYGVNAKRLNYIATNLQKQSKNQFNIPFITQKTHPVYFESNVQWEGPGLGLGKKVY